jgi:hypothetical protein
MAPARGVADGGGQGWHGHPGALAHPWKVESWLEKNRGVLATCRSDSSGGGSPAASPQSRLGRGGSSGERWYLGTTAGGLGL